MGLDTDGSEEDTTKILKEYKEKSDVYKDENSSKELLQPKLKDENSSKEMLQPKHVDINHKGSHKTHAQGLLAKLDKMEKGELGQNVSTKEDLVTEPEVQFESSEKTLAASEAVKKQSKI